MPLAALIFGAPSHSDDFKNLVLVQVFEASRGYNLLVVLLGEKQTGILQSLTVKGIRIFENVAHVFHRDALGQDVFTFLLDRGYIETVGKREHIIKMSRLNLDLII